MVAKPSRSTEGPERPRRTRTTYEEKRYGNTTFKITTTIEHDPEAVQAFNEGIVRAHLARLPDLLAKDD